MKQQKYDIFISSLHEDSTLYVHDARNGERIINIKLNSIIKNG